MKEKDIVNFDEMETNGEGEHVDSDGKVVGCHICYTHDKADDILRKKQFGRPIVGAYLADLESYHPLCPECGKPLSPGANHGYAPDGYVTVTEGNFSQPDGEVSLCQAWYCENEKCPSEEHQYLFAMMPIPIVWNANHDIHYTGGKSYLLEADAEKFAEDIFERFKPSIEQYVRRKLDPKDDMDRMIDMSNVLLWCERDVENAIATWMYERGLKK